MAQIWRRLVSLVAILVLAALPSAAYDRVCREPGGIVGFEASAARAHRFLPGDTSDPLKAVVYIEKTPLGYYYHSNFITPYPGITVATKVASDHLADAQQAFYNILYVHGSDDAGQVKAIETYRNNVHILLDRSVFSAGGYPLVDVKDAKNVAIVDGSTGEFLGRADTLSRTSPPPMLLAKILV